jgi:hypothetical protein
VRWSAGSAAAAFAVAALLSASAVILLAGISEPNGSVGSPRHPLVEVREAPRSSSSLLRPIF